MPPPTPVLDCDDDVDGSQVRYLRTSISIGIKNLGMSGVFAFPSCAWAQLALS